jgi:VWFA-related protein
MWRGAALSFVICAVLPVAGFGAGGQGGLDLWLREYRTGDADRAVSEIATWREDRLDDALLLSVVDRPWDVAATVLAYSEAGRLSGRFGANRLDQPIIAGREDGAEPYYRISHTLISRLLDQHDADPQIIEFCRTWIVWATAVLSWNEVGSRPLELGERSLEHDPEILLARGAHAEFWMGPQILGGRYEFDPLETLTPNRRQAVSTPHGVMSVEHARGAERRYAQVLERPDNAAKTEALLRLGRVYGLLNRQQESEEHLMLAAADRSERGARNVSYLSRLFLGWSAGFHDRPEQARIWYREALATYPEGTAARIGGALSLFATGQPADGWQEMRRVFGEPGRPATVIRDPWVMYPSRFWVVGPYLRRLRSMVAQQPVSGGDRSRASAALRPTPLAADAREADVAQNSSGFRARIDAVRVDVLVTRGDSPVTGLGPANFELRDNGVRQEVQSATLAETLSVALVVDASASTSFTESWRPMMVAAQAVADALRQGDTASIVTVSDRFELIAHKAEPRDVRQALGRLSPDRHAKTSLWDGALAAASLVAEEPGRPLVVVISDGGDNASWCGRSCALNFFRSAGVIVDGIAPTRYGHDSDTGYGPVSFDAIGRASGGAALRADDPRLASVLANRFATLRTGYVLWYSPRGVSAGDGWHKIEVSLNGARGRVVARPGYVSTRR